MRTESYTEGDLTLNVEETKFLIRIEWLGRCTMQSPAIFLDPIILREYQNSLKDLKRLIFDFTSFESMNSSAIIPIINILKRVKNGRGSIHVLYNAEQRWQKILLGELKIFETEDDRIQILAKK